MVCVAHASQRGLRRTGQVLQQVSSPMDTLALARAAPSPIPARSPRQPRGRGRDAERPHFVASAPRPAPTRPWAASISCCDIIPALTQTASASRLCLVMTSLTSPLISSPVHVLGWNVYRYPNCVADVCTASHATRRSADARSDHGAALRALFSQDLRPASAAALAAPTEGARARKERTRQLIAALPGTALGRCTPVSRRCST
jgi:hypothetical protein